MGSVGDAADATGNSALRAAAKRGEDVGGAAGVGVGGRGADALFFPFASSSFPTCADEVAGVGFGVAVGVGVVRHRRNSGSASIARFARSTSALTSGAGWARI